MDAATRMALIQHYRDGYRAVAEALARIPENEMDLCRDPGDTWSPRRIVHHLADSEMTSALRLRRLIAEERPEIMAYDEQLWANSLYYDERPIGPSLDALAAARASTADILSRLTEAQWAREGTHSEVGGYSVETWLEIYAAHARDHAAQMLRAAGKEG